MHLPKTLRQKSTLFPKPCRSVRVNRRCVFDVPELDGRFLGARLAADLLIAGRLY
jgi:hypothetical protein